eukprot:TRINITY_DN677_c0_g1_i2.p1 TRINITY_DN677_c0_g1~~TRINITY_DN677_c0_g1_i2.p1  ORF type:complete len:140 (-),score=16.96 TRINITY_DN677_c0_g1_i2:29-412(-)
MATAGSADAPAPPPELAALTNEAGKNTVLITCRLCGSKILRPNMGTLVHKPMDLPASRAGDAAAESEAWFWEVHDMFTFENIGFSHAVENRKFLTCADCERDILGAMFTEDTAMLWLSSSRVKYDSA